METDLGLVRLRQSLLGVAAALVLAMLATGLTIRGSLAAAFLMAPLLTALFLLPFIIYVFFIRTHVGSLVTGITLLVTTLAVVAWILAHRLPNPISGALFGLSGLWPPWPLVTPWIVALVGVVVDVVLRRPRR